MLPDRFFLTRVHKSLRSKMGARNSAFGTEITTVDTANYELMKPDSSRQLHARAMFFKRLAVGAADPKFAAQASAAGRRV